MRSILRMALLGLILVLVAAVSGLTAMRFAIHGREVSVPKLIGLTPAEARRVAADNGLLLNIESHFYSAHVPEGRIVTQVPPAGVRVSRGWQVRVAESLGPQRRVVPSVLGESQRAAEINLRRRGLDLGTIAQAQIPGAEPDQVLAQSPTPNAAGAAAPTVSILVAATPEPPQFLMPDLSGQRLADVSKKLLAAGMHLGKVTEVEGASGPTGTVVRQAPAPGQKVVAGTAVNLDVAK